MSNFVSLDDAARKLGVSVEELVEMRSRGEIFGYRDGGSWKFKPEEIERVAGELLGDALDEDPAGSSILSDLLPSDGSDAVDAGSSLGSDVALVPEEGADSDVRLVANTDSDAELQLADSDDDDEELSSASGQGDDLLDAISEASSDVTAAATGAAAGAVGAAAGKLGLSSDDDDDLKLADDEGSELKLAGDSDNELSLADSDGDLNLAGGSSGSSDVPLGSDLGLGSSDPSGVISGSGVSLDGGGSDLITGDSDPDINSSGLGSDLELDDGDDLVLGGGSDLALGSDSGINLMSPADSGISLEDEPLDLAASGISGLDLAAEGSGSDVGGSAVGGSAVDFQQDDEFQLSPSGVIDGDDDSGSQVIELEDSSEFGDAAVALPEGDGGFDAFSDVDGGGGLDEAEGLAPTASTAAAVGVPEVPYSLLEVLFLLGILLLMSLSGILVTDIVRNMWAWSGSESTLTSGFTDMVLSAFGQK